MKRVFSIKVNINKGVTYEEETIFTQGDNQTHYLKIIFEDEINFSGKTMKINFIRPNKTSVFTMITNIGKINEVLIPNNALNIIGNVLIEIVLLEGEKILTVNKLARFVVTETTAGSNLEMIPGNELISEMNNLIVELNRLLTESKKEINDFTGNKKEEINKYVAALKDEQNKGILGKSNGKFPLSSATKGNVYLLEETRKYYICTTAYSGTEISVPNTNFEELSVFQNRNKLENLDNKWLKYGKFDFRESPEVIVDLSNYPAEKLMFLIFRHNGSSNAHSLWFMSNNNETGAYTTAFNMFNWNKDLTVQAASLGNYKTKFYLSSASNYIGDIYLFFLN